jgi:hypothetical protein
VTGPDRGYRWLLRAYPAWYRRQRGEELLDTLLAAAPDGGAWPSLQDSRALILGGLRVRAGQHQRQASAASLRLAVLLGVVLWLAGQASGALALAGAAWLHWVSASPAGAADAAGTGLAVLAAAAAAWFASRPVTVAVSLAAATACACQMPDPWLLLGVPTMLAALALLAWGNQRVPRSWLWLLGIEFAAQTLTGLASWGSSPLTPLLGVLNDDLPWGILAAVVLWAIVDARPAIALSISTALGRAILLATLWHDTDFGPVFYMPIAGGAVLALLMALRLRRQAAL